MSRVSKSAALALAAAVCAAIVAVPAQAKTEQIKSGHTTVTMSPLVKALLAKTGITVNRSGPRRPAAARYRCRWQADRCRFRA